MSIFKQDQQETLLSIATTDDEELSLTTESSQQHANDNITNGFKYDDHLTAEDDKISFLNTFFLKSNGAIHVFIIVLLSAAGIGSTFGVRPAVMADRYARLDYGYTGDDCSSFLTSDEQPKECKDGFDDASRAAAFALFARSILEFTLGAAIGSISDLKGRKVVFTAVTFVQLPATIILILTQLIPTMHPTWFYTFFSFEINWMSIAFTCLADIMPPQWRAPSNGVLMAAFFIAVVTSPLMAVVLNHLSVSIMAAGLQFVAILWSICLLPETYPQEARMVAVERRQEEERRGEWASGIGYQSGVCDVLYRPFKELSILNRHNFFRLLSIVAFFNTFLYQANLTLGIYYIENDFNFGDKEVAMFFLALGCSAVLCQGFLLKLLVRIWGERRVVIVSFVFSTATNIVYGLADSRTAIFIGATLNGVASMAFPTISSMKSFNVDETEQGRIQGALFSVTALAGGLGPISLRMVYEVTDDKGGLGGGWMFIVGAIISFIGLLFACALASEKANSRNIEPEAEQGVMNGGENVPGGDVEYESLVD